MNMMKTLAATSTAIALALSLTAGIALADGDESETEYECAANMGQVLDQNGTIDLNATDADKGNLMNAAYDSGCDDDDDDDDDDDYEDDDDKSEYKQSDG